MRTLVDLCTGLGGLSRPFRECATWRVVTVDVDPRVRPDVIADMRALPLVRPPGPLFLWASIPCERFSRFSQPGLFPDEPPPDLSCARAFADLVQDWRPEEWCIENVMGARKFLSPIFGQVRAITGGHVFWGSLALFPPLRRHKKNVPQQTGEWLRKLKRAKLPYELGYWLARTVLAEHAEEVRW